MQITGHFSVGQNRVNNKGVRNDGAEDHCENIHQNHTGEVIKIKLECSHTVFDMSADQIEKVEEKIAAGLDDKSLTEIKRLEELKEIEYEQQDRLNAAIDYLREYDSYSRYVENLSIVLDRLKELERGV